MVYEALAGTAGLNVTFDSRFLDTLTPFKLDNVSVLDALDFLSLLTGTFWEVLNNKTIIVAPDTVRRELQPPIEKTIYLTHTTTQPGISEIITALRTLLNIGQIEQNSNAIVLRDSADKIALAETLVADLDLPERR